MSMDQHQDDESSFAQGFASVAGPDSVQDTPATAEVVTDEPGAATGSNTPAEAAPSPEPAAVEAAANQPEASTPTNTPEASQVPPDDGAGGAGATPGGAEPQAAAELAEEARIAGFTETEIRTLLAKAAKVEELEQSVRKVYGKIGELNGRLPTQPSKEQVEITPAPTQAPSSSTETFQIDPSVFGDFSEEALAQGIAKVVAQAQKPLLESIAQLEARNAGTPHQAAAQAEHVPAQEQPQQAAPIQHQAVELTPEELERHVQRGTLTHIRPKWEEEVHSPEFKSWIESDETGSRRQTYYAANTAVTLAGVLDQFDQWKAASNAALQQSAKSQRRLENAITPTGNAPRPQSAPDEQQSFESAFASVRGR